MNLEHPEHFERIEHNIVLDMNAQIITKIWIL